MGASQAFVLSISIIELTLLAILAVAIGALLGYLAQEGLAWLLHGLIRSDLPPASPAPLLIALATVLAMLVGFALPPLLQLKNTPPARVLRNERERAAASLRLRANLLALAALFAILWSLVRDGELVLYVLAGVLGRGVGVDPWPGSGWCGSRAGCAAAWESPGATVWPTCRGGAAAASCKIVAFGLGLMVLLLLAVVRGDLLADWRHRLPTDAPNNFLINIRPEERQTLQDFLGAHGLGKPQMYPMVRARMTAINSQPSSTLKFPGDAGKGFLEREQNLTWSADLDG